MRGGSSSGAVTIKLKRGLSVSAGLSSSSLAPPCEIANEKRLAGTGGAMAAVRLGDGTACSGWVEEKAAARGEGETKQGENGWPGNERRGETAIICW